MSDVAADLRLDHSRGETRVFLGVSALARAHSWLESWVSSRHVFVVTTRVVAALALDKLSGSLSTAANVSSLLVDEGEEAKSLANAERLWGELLAAGGRRDSRLIGLGGGSVGDLVGFIAGTFLRGVEFSLVPTTLLAQVDASIGGKTAIDMPLAKNSVGMFWFPSAVVSDVALLETLSRAEVQSGVVEVIKIAAGRDIELFEELESGLEDLLGGDPELLSRIIRRSVADKIQVVMADPFEGDLRRVLNLGHTLGHAIETTLDYQQLRHGEAVAYGLMFAIRLARARGGAEDWLDRVDALLGRLELPSLPSLELDELLVSLTRDKKATRQGLCWVLPKAPGEVEIVNDVEPGELRAELGGFLSDLRRPEQ